MKTSPYLLGFLIIGLCAKNSLLAQAPTADDLNHGLQIDVDDVNDIATFSWWGVIGETYFMQVTPELTSGWEYVDHIYSGADDELGHSFAVNSDKFFFRLVYTNQPTTDPQNDDFDLDGIGNLAELTQDTDPFGWEDLNADQIPDDWETYWAGQVALFAPDLLNQTILVGDSHVRPMRAVNDSASAANISVSMTLNDVVADVYGWEENPVYNWIDISPAGNGEGTMLSGISDADDASQAILLEQMKFPFFDREYDSVWVSSNGHLNLSQMLNDDGNNLLPSANDGAIIAPFWDDLNTGYSGTVYYLETPDYLIVQYDDVSGRSAGDGYRYTFQVVLHANGKIEFLYEELIGDVESATVGVQDYNSERETLIVYNQPFLHDAMAISLDLTRKPIASLQEDYVWEDSLSGDVAHTWTDISEIGTPILLPTVSSTNNTSEKITLSQISLPFYGDQYNEVWVSSNGYLKFSTDPDLNYGQPLPSSNAPAGLIAPLWGQLSTELGGNIYYIETAEKLVIQYDQIEHVLSQFVEGTWTYTFQVVLYSNGKIEFLYHDLGESEGLFTVGLQDMNRDQFTQIARNDSYLESNMTIRLMYGEPFTLSPDQAVLPDQQSQLIDLILNKDFIGSGKYTGTISFVHDGVGESPQEKPFEFLIYSDDDNNGIPDEWSEDSDKDGLIDGWELETYGHLGLNYQKDSDQDGYLDYQDSNSSDPNLGLLKPVIVLPAEGAVY